MLRIYRAALRIAGGAFLLVIIGSLTTTLRSPQPARTSTFVPTTWPWPWIKATASTTSTSTSTTTATTATTATTTTTEDPGPPPLPPPDDYAHETEQPPFCRDRYTTKYLDDLRNHPTQYCAAGARSRLTCFHSHTTASGSAIVSLCVGHEVTFDAGKFTLDCPQRDVRADSISADEVPLDMVESYWYDTGPKYILDNYVKLLEPSAKGDVEPATQQQKSAPGGGDAPSFVLLLKREVEARNPWHTLLEIMSASWTVDVLRMARDPASGLPVFRAPEDVANTQVVILDEHGDGPYFDLWRMFSGREPKRLAELASASASSSSPSWLSGPIDNIIIPLASASNPLWHDDWANGKCTQNPLLHTFVNRVLARHGLLSDDHDNAKDDSKAIQVTFIDRRDSRRLIGLDGLLGAVRARLPKVHVQAVDFAALSLAEQLRVARDTDVLVGVHGAGLTNMMFMRAGGLSAVVEIQPAELHYQVYRNLALMLGHGYYVAHVTSIDPPPAAASRRRAVGVALGVESQAAAGSGNGTTDPTSPSSLRRRGEPAENEEHEYHSVDVEMEEDRFVHVVEMAVKSLYNKGGRFDDAV